MVASAVAVVICSSMLAATGGRWHGHHNACPGVLRVQRARAASRSIVRKPPLEPLGPPSIQRAFPVVLAAVSVPAGSGPSRTNVELAAAALDGCLLSPGREFSFNQVVGERSADAGYQLARVYQQGEAVPGIGGGVCKVSTALYEAALRSGMQVLERQHHSGPVGYAPPGLDAAVAYGSVDLRIRNTIGQRVMVRAAATDGELVVRLLGARPLGEAVSVKIANLQYIPPPEVQVPDDELPAGDVAVVDAGRRGYRVDTLRVLRAPHTPVRTELVSRDLVQPRPRVVRVSVRLTEGEEEALRALACRLNELRQAIMGHNEPSPLAEAGRDANAVGGGALGANAACGQGDAAAPDGR